MWKGVPGHLLMAENRLQEQVLGQYAKAGVGMLQKHAKQLTDSPLPRSSALQRISGEIPTSWKKMAERG